MSLSFSEGLPATTAINLISFLLADEISPDTCRLWDQTEKDPQKRVMDKDRFRRDLGKVETAYQQVQKRVLEQLGSAKKGL